MRFVVLVAAASILSTTVPRPGTAQLFDRMSNPKVTVTLNHPPDLGLLVGQFAFGPATGQRADEVVMALQRDLAASGMRVLDQRGFLNALADHQFVYTGFIDQPIAIGMGKFLGPTALLMVDVSRANIDRQQSSSTSTDNHNVKHTTWRSKTRAELRVSIRAVDLRTGQSFPPQVLDRNAEKENVVEEKCCASYPSEREVFELALQQVVADAHRLLVVWAEPQDLIFFDDKDCHMNVASDMVKAGDIQGAARQSESNVEACKATPDLDDKKLAHSYYNVGMVAFLEGRYNNALYMFEQAQKVKDIGITTDAMTLVKRAMQSYSELQAFVARRADALGAATSEARTGATDSAPARLSPLERLKALDAAYKAGLLTKEEYDKKKAEILKEM